MLYRQNLYSLFTKYLRPLIYYGDIIYDQPRDSFFCEKLESVQYKAALAIIGTIQGTSREKMLQELGFESLKSRRWFRRLCCMFNIMKNEAPNYLISLIPEREQTLTQETNIYQSIFCRADSFKHSFFPLHCK